MIGRAKWNGLAGASGIAIAAALMLSPDEAAACTFVPIIDAGVVENVRVFCEDGDTAQAFSTSFTDQIIEGTTFSYDGNGADEITVNDGGAVIQDDSGDTPTPGTDTAATAPARLNETTGTVETLGGDDRLTMNGGTIGEADEPVSVFFGDGADQLRMQGGTIFGSVFGQGGGNTIDVFGTGVITGSIFAGSQNDTVTLSDTAQVQGQNADPDAIGLEDGDDTFDMSGGTVGAAVSGGAGVDRLEVSGGTIARFLAGNAGNDTIVFSGGLIQDALGEGGIQGNEGDDQITVSGGTTTVVSGDEGDDTITISDDAAVESVSGGTGNDAVTVSGGMIDAGIATDLAGDDDQGDDTVTVSGGAIGAGGAGDIATLGGDDTVVFSGGTLAGSVVTGVGNDEVRVSGGTINGAVQADAGADEITVSGGSVAGGVLAGDGEDAVTVSGNAEIGEAGSGASVDLAEENDTFQMTGGSLAGDVRGRAGNDGITVSGGRIEGFVAGDDGADRVSLSGGIIVGGVNGGSGADTVAVTDAADVRGDFNGGDGNDEITVSGGTIAAEIDGDDGDDRISVSGGVQTGGIAAGAGSDVLRLSGGLMSGAVGGGGDNDDIALTGIALAGSVSGDGGNDEISISAGVVSRSAAGAGGNVDGGAGNDAVTVSGGGVEADVTGGAGDDDIGISGGAVGGDVAGNDGDDTVTLSGGAISGDIDAETVRLFGGTLGGDVSGLSGNTLVIDDGEAPAALNLRDGVTFSGTDAVGTVTDTDLAQGGESQNFQGFATLGLAGSTLRFENAAQGIGALTLADGSTLFVNGAAALQGGGGFGDLAVNGSTLNLIDGDPTDTLEVADLTLNGATVGIDVDQAAGLADAITARGIAAATGANTIRVNLVNEPVLQEAIDIPILSAAGDPVGGDFSVAGITGTPAALFTYEIVEGPDGGLVLRATPNAAAVGAVSAVDGAASSAVADNMTEALFSVTQDAAKYGLGLGGGGPAPLSSTFGVFASGQLARVDHDGFDISTGDGTLDGPSFDSNDFSAAISLDWNAAKSFQFDNEYGLNLGLFAGYATTEVDLDAFGGVPVAGAADNKSGMAGAYGLFRRELNYLLVSGMVLFGNTDVVNAVAGADGEYDTLGYAVAASAGHIFLLGEKTRFDLRGGLLGASFKGDEYEDSVGLEHGESKVSFGAVKFEPGIYADYAWENGMVFSPYARADIQVRFGYENESSVEGESFDFDDEDFSGAISAGANLKISDSSTLSAEGRGKFSADSTTLGGKLGLKVAF